MRVFTAITEGLPSGTTIINEETGEASRTYKLNDKANGIPYLFYSETTGILKLRLSIPKFLFGNNVQELTETDIEVFWTKLEQYLAECFNINIPREQWIVEEIDVCQNIKLDSQQQVQHYIEQIHKKHVPYLKPHLYGRNQTVEFSNSDRSRRIKFYDKQAQLKDTKEPEHLIQMAHGILRLEVTPSYNDLRTYTKQRKATDILTERFFNYVLNKNKVHDLLNIEAMDKPSIESLKQLKPDDRAKILEFMYLQQHYSDSEIKQLMSVSTMKRRRKAVKDLLDKIKKSTKMADLIRMLG
jgi:hypothetical protein